MIINVHLAFYRASVNIRSAFFTNFLNIKAEHLEKEYSLINDEKLSEFKKKFTQYKQNFQQYLSDNYITFSKKSIFICLFVVILVIICEFIFNLSKLVKNSSNEKYSDSSLITVGRLSVSFFVIFLILGISNFFLNVEIFKISIIFIALSAFIYLCILFNCLKKEGTLSYIFFNKNPNNYTEASKIMYLFKHSDFIYLYFEIGSILYGIILCSAFFLLNQIYLLIIFSSLGLIFNFIYGKNSAWYTSMLVTIYIISQILSVFIFIIVCIIIVLTLIPAINHIEGLTIMVKGYISKIDKILQQPLAQALITEKQ